MKRARTVLGWNELVALPEWGALLLPAKIDSGARSSSLHVEELSVDGDRVTFTVPDAGHHPGHHAARIEAKVVRIARVTSSNGRAQKRIFVETTLHLGPILRKVEINLVSRGDMRFPMLIGRTALRRHFLVNPGRCHLASPPTLPEH